MTLFPKTHAARALAVLSGAVLTVLVVAGCGGSGRLSEQELVSQANTICRGYHRRLDRLGASDTLPQLARFATRARPILAGALTDLRELKPPKEIEADYLQWVDETERDVDLLDDIEAAARKGDEARIERISDAVTEADARSDRIARRIGLDACAAD